MGWGWKRSVNVRQTCELRESESKDKGITMAKVAKVGRPVVFKGNVKKQVVSAIKKHGLTHGRVVLAEKGVSISMPTLGKLAREAGIELRRGRPAAA